MKKKNKGFIFAYSVVIMMIISVLITVILSMSQAGSVKNNMLQAKINARNALDQTAEYFIGEYVKATDKTESGSAYNNMKEAAKNAKCTVEIEKYRDAEIYSLIVKSSDGKIMLRVKVSVGENQDVTVQEYVYSPSEESTQKAG